MKKVITMILVLAALFTFVACQTPADGGDTTAAVTTAGDTTPTGPETDASGNPVDSSEKVDANGYLCDSIPDELDYKKKKVTFLVWDGQSYEEFDVEANTGEMVNNSIYDRNLMVEERLGVDLSFVKTKGGSKDYEEFTQKVNADIMAGSSHEYDMIAAYSRTTAMCAYNGYTRNLLDTKYFDVDKPWWPDTLMKQSVINDKLYFCSGDISASLFHNLNVVYFNKKLANDYDITTDSLYKLVTDKQWTLDKLIELTENTYIDLDNDGNRGTTDQYGMIAANTQSQPFVWGCGITAIDVSDSKMVVSDTFVGEKMQGVLEKLVNWLYNTDGGYFASSTGTGNTAFAEGRCVFFSNIASYSMSKFNVDGLEFGILPIPMYDTNQDDYHTVMGNAFTLYAILNTDVDADMCSAVLECMGSEGYRQVSPALFETAMKIKYASDDITSQMYDIVRASALFDNGRIFSGVIDDLFTKTYNDAIKNKSTSWMPAIAAIRSSLDAKIVSLNETFEAFQ